MKALATVRNRILLSAIMLVASSAAHGAEVRDSLASPMVNTSIYREGEVRRLSGSYARWTLVCDEIIALKQRYCSLRSTPATDPVIGALSIDVSTGDNGLPAALLHLPLAVSVAFGVEVSVDHPTKALPKRRAPAEPASARVAIVTCDQHECLAAWSLGASSTQALTDGSGLRLTFCTSRAAPMEFAADLRQRSCQVKTLGLVSGLGFRDAVQASMN